MNKINILGPQAVNGLDVAGLGRSVSEKSWTVPSLQVRSNASLPENHKTRNLRSAVSHVSDITFRYNLRVTVPTNIEQVAVFNNRSYFCPQTRDEHGSELDRTGSRLKPILAGSGLDRTGIFLKIGGSGLDLTEKSFVVLL